MAFSLRKLIGGIFGRGKPEPPPPPPPPPEGPRLPPPPPGGGPPGGARYRDIWNRTVQRATVANVTARTGYSEAEVLQAHLEIFLAMPGMTEEEPREKYRLWREYVKVMVNSGVSKRERLAFFDDMHITDQDFSWELWRNIMGYSRHA